MVAGRGPRDLRVVALLRSQILWGVVLIIVGLAVGPGGYSIFYH